MPLRGLTALAVTADGDRLHAALTYAAAAAAMGEPAHVHLHEAAVGLLRDPLGAPGDNGRARAGLPTLAQLIDEALTLGVRITLCQSGLAVSGLALDQLDSRLEVEGPVGILAGLGDHRMLIF